MRLDTLAMDVEIPDGVTVDIAPDHVITIKGKKGEVKRTFHAIGITVAREGNTVVFSAKNATKKEKTMIGTFRAHLKNMVTGVVNGHQYKMKICSGHFPMTVAVKGNELTIKNFLGEKVPRIARLLDGVSVKVEGSDVSIDSPDLEKAGIVASRIELATFISRRDRRVFQDGIFITSKPGVEKI